MKDSFHTTYSYVDDCQRITNICQQYYQVEISLEQAAVVWGEYSEIYGSKWMTLPDDDQDVLLAVEHFLRKMEA